MIAIQDIAYVRYGAPDLDLMQAFLEDFGLHLTHRSESTLYMGGASDSPFVHVTERRDHAVPIGFGLRAKSLEDLQILASKLATTVEKNSAPGGGDVVRFVDPAGLSVEVVYGQTAVQSGLPALPVRKPIAVNRNGQRERNGTVRLAPAPSNITRLGHVAVQVSDIPRVVDFYTNTLGFKISDSYWAGAKDNTIAVFLHCGLGEHWTDHHTIALIAAQDNRTRFDHSAFEVLDLDDLMQGNAFLARQGHQHSWGVGRHIQGSQIFDYWRDPFGNKIEHWTDGDMVNDASPLTHVELNPGELAQWGPALSPSFFD
ncbi:VOC family protein [Glaciimonas sp. PAMC28666]|nr:VOC family protein [Glaciimonas sp. PAMC28666]QRX81722.1 VOC family protein [Glaciimonas sp. PAMC28666]